MSDTLEQLETILGHRFRNRELLSRSLTHKSRIFEKAASEDLSDNERLEFLGDSILGFLVSEFLLERHPEASEGTLSKLKSRLVSEVHLLSVARALDLGRFLILGRGEEMSGGRGKKALLADCVEAILAALYLDEGMGPARDFVKRHIIACEMTENAGEPVAADYKSALQERAQRLKLPPPRYSILEERGPEHAKTFVVEARIGREWSGRAEGLSKKSASQEAARLVIQQLPEQTP
jgi:ribonuclease-3